MKKRKTALAVLGLTVGLLIAGCGKQTEHEGWNTSENSVYVTRDGGVQSALVYSSEQFNELYKAEELEEFAKQAVARYNSGETENSGQQVVVVEDQASETEKPSVALQSCKLENRTGFLVFDYASPEDYLEFAKFSGDNTNTLTKLQIAEAEKAAELLSGVSLVTADGKAADSSKVVGSDRYTVVYAEGSGTICTEGKIAFVSEGSGVTIRDPYTALTGEGTHVIVFK